MPPMPKALQTALLMLRELLFTAGPFALLAAGLLWGAYHLLQPTPPRSVVLDVAQAEAYSRRFTFLSPVLLPRGVADLVA